MNIDPNLLRRVAGDLAALDFSAENARIATLEARIVEAEAALAKAQARRDEISDMLRPYVGPAGRSGGEFIGNDGMAVANALLAGASTADAAAASTTQEELNREREALGAAAVELRERITSAEQSIRTMKIDSRKRALPAVQPLAEAVGRQMRDAAETIRDCWAVLEALSAATASMSSELRGARDVVPALHADYSLLERRGPVPVPADVVRALSALADKGPALASGQIRSSFYPYQLS